MVRVRVRVMVKDRVKVRFRVQNDLDFDPWRHSEPFIWETYLLALGYAMSLSIFDRNLISILAPSFHPLL